MMKTRKDLKIKQNEITSPSDSIHSRVVHSNASLKFLILTIYIDTHAYAYESILFKDKKIIKEFWSFYNERILVKYTRIIMCSISLLFILILELPNIRICLFISLTQFILKIRFKCL